MRNESYESDPMSETIDISVLKSTWSSPLDPAALLPVLAPIGQARTLPAEAYTSAEVHQWELANFFEGSWVCAGRSSVLERPGDQTAVRVGTEGILLVRDADGALRGFYNVCRHRGHELLECGATTNRRGIVCPYHAWAYGLDGRLRGAPRFKHLTSTDPVHEGLLPAAVSEWHGWLFVNPSGAAPPFAQHVGNLDELVSAHRPEQLVRGATHHYEVTANWKIVVENYHECYHCTSIHPELCRITPPSSGDSSVPTGLWVGGSMDLMPHAKTMSISGESQGVFLPGLDEGSRRQVFYYGLFPTFLISLHPDYVLTHRLEPLTPDRTRIECQWLFPAEAMERADFDPSYAVEFWDLTNRQDWQACESVQRGVASRGYRQGPLAIEEDNVHQFQTMVAGGYLQGRPARPVPPARRATSPSSLEGSFGN
jgi:phenylpropionate dioxygenase-like ring-hydroxylating dioxygenase large terminal subunit